MCNCMRWAYLTSWVIWMRQIRLHMEKKGGGGLSINDSVLYVHRLAVFNFVNRRS